MALVYFNFKHGIGEGFNYFTLNLNFILFWHIILSLTAGLQLLSLHIFVPLGALRGSLHSDAYGNLAASMHLKVQKGSSCYCCSQLRIIAYFL
ncbi:MAG TPA: hypothetical protein VKX46_09710, partial [Ktedonobacteraceae bacterium]|nr:hypothetical protein [Ktedonobacteraceae bacterium]